LIEPQAISKAKGVEMGEQATTRALKKAGLFQGMTNAELQRVAQLCEQYTYSQGELSVKQGEPQTTIHIIQKGRMGVETQLPSAPRDMKEIIVDVMSAGEVYPWAALMRKTASASVRAMEPTKAFKLEVDKLIELCEEDNHIGYVVMKNLASIISSRLTRHRLAMLSAVSGIGEGW
jgi:CRP/FNR family cyclic AMP-dependent transcriptional regulator